MYAYIILFVMGKGLGYNLDNQINLTDIISMERRCVYAGTNERSA